VAMVDEIGVGKIAVPDPRTTSDDVPVFERNGVSAVILDTQFGDSKYPPPDRAVGVLSTVPL